jgi:hypothetical protein
MNNGPLTFEFEDGFDNALRQELTTYAIKDGNLVRTTVVRVYSADRDYTDAMSTVILGQVWEKVNGQKINRCIQTQKK